MSVRSAAVLAAALIVFGSTSPAMSQDAEINAEAIGDWEVARGEDRCHVLRQFGDPANPFRVKFTSIDPWDGGYQVDLAGPGRTSGSGPFTVEWVPAGDVSVIDLRQSIPDDADTGWVRFGYGPRTSETDSMSGEELGAFYSEGGYERFREGVQHLRVRDLFSGPVNLQTGEIATISDLLDACITEVFQSNGIESADIERDDHRVQPTNVPAIMPILTSRVPLVIRSRPRRTMVNFLLYLDDEARPTSCRLSTLPYDREYEQRTCRNLLSTAQFRFKPGEEARPTWFKLWFIQEPG